MAKLFHYYLIGKPIFFEDMAFGLYSLLESTILFVNALAVLNRDRFLRKIGLVPERKSGNDKLLGLANFIHSIQTVMRVPLIVVNSLLIIPKRLPKLNQTKNYINRTKVVLALDITLRIYKMY
ncbi:Immediate early response 3-interacting protein 1 [Trichinella pseudospiralis]|uniref:Immediate early response 3-interacting protein 1 n=1 Tax=Trichinella pseudospiralis TaxID=6337 RepID=A0A0V1G2I7_TRIPS|nr:Immediate early response 3-interacting protein 1 [Trichinella pseudospiralis]